MTTVLLAAVGNHDVQVTDRLLLPEDIRDTRTPARIEGEALLADLDRYRETLSYPLIAPVVQWLFEDQGVQPSELYVHLFATDQPQAYTPEKEWRKDTYAYAQIIQRALVDGMPGVKDPQSHRLPKKQVRIQKITSNPANYRAMLDVITELFTKQKDHLRSGDQVYLEVTGGTPAMTSMMIVAGADIFGEQARCLYKDQDDDRPKEIGVLERFFARQARAALREQLKLYAYTAACATFREHRLLVADSHAQQELLAALLTYAERRLAFDFNGARAALVEAERWAEPELQPQIGYLRRQLQAPGDAALLAELVHNARVKYQLGQYADFTQRLFRFQEASFRYLARKMGMRYKEETGAHMGEYVDPVWSASVPGLLDHLKCTENKPWDKPIDIKRQLNRINLGAVVHFFVETDPDWAAYRSAMEDLYRLNSLSTLRNKGLAGHDFDSVSKENLTDAFGEDADEIVPLLERIYAALFKSKLGKSPYDVANEIIVAHMDA